MLLCGVAAHYVITHRIRCVSTKPWESNACLAETIGHINESMREMGLDAVPLAVVGWFDVSMRERLESLLREPVVIDTAMARVMGTLLVLTPVVLVVAGLTVVDVVGRALLRLD